MRLSILLAALALVSTCVAAKAESITFTITDTASGSIGGQSFTNQNITVTLTGDTSNVAYLPVNYYYIAPGTTTIQIGSLGTFTVTDPTRFYDNQIYSIAGISDSASGSILGTANAAFGSYTDTTSIGPLSGASSYYSSYLFNTSGGAFNFTSAGSTSTLTAVLGATASPTPEPSSLALLGTGLLGFAGVIRRRLS